jgi:phage/plasmid-like protein (TIGR03299 family)|nr:DUF932 domain-containing protein [uncultured Lachnoclostridium sp.]
MSAEVETMFYVRTTPWHGLGTRVEEVLSAEEALIKSGLNWEVQTKEIQTNDGIMIPGYQANVRSTDGRVLGVVSDRYKIVQNKEAFDFTNALLGEGVRYETAGSIFDGKKIWILAKLPEKYIMSGDEITPYLVFSNAHDGSNAIKVAMTPIRVVCNNTLNLALSSAQRIWSTKHTGDMSGKLKEAKDTLFMAHEYMLQLGVGIDELTKKKLRDEHVTELIKELLPLPDSSSEQQERNIEKLRKDMGMRYFYAPDLKRVGKNGYRFINAVSDFATHAKPLRETKNYRENLFARVMDGNALIDKAYELMKVA